MRVPFRQGIVKSPSNFLTVSAGGVHLTASPSAPVIFTVADGTSDYLCTETKTINNAWTGPFDSNNSYWLFWDIDTISGEKTYGYTTTAPTSGSAAPSSPANGACWFDTSSATMHEYNSAAGRWVRKVRVFAAQLSANDFTSLSINSPNFEGTQAGIISSVSAGALVFDAAGKAIKKGDGTFYTTEDVVSTSLGAGTLVKLESIAVTARATAPCAAYTMVRLSGYDEFSPATNLMADAGVYGIIETAANYGDLVTIVREGVVTNMAWDWIAAGAAINAPVFVTSTGELTTAQQPSQAVGVVVNHNSVLLTATIVDNITLVESAVTIRGPSAGVIVTGSSGDKSSSFNVTLANDLAAVEGLSTTGVVRRIGDGVWTAGLLDAGEISGVLQPAHGGTGSSLISTGHVSSANGVLTSSPTIPGADVVGDISGAASNVSGIVAVAHGGTGAATQSGAMNNIAPAQSLATIGQALVSDGTDVVWASIGNGTVQSVDAIAGTPGISVSGAPITTSGTLTLSLTGNVGSMATVTSPGVLGQTATGDVLSHTIVSPTNTVQITNGNTTTSGSIELNLPVVNIHGSYAEVTADQYGRVISGSPYLTWSKVTNTPTTIAGMGVTDVYTKNQIDAYVWNWSAIASPPTTISGYGITDTYTKNQTDAKLWSWSSIIATPGTLSGYGITDGIVNAGGAISVAIGASINKPTAGMAGRIYIDTTTGGLSYDNGGAWMGVGKDGTVTSVSISTSAGLSATNNTVTTSGTISLGLADDLAAIENLSTTGFSVRTGPNSWATREIVGTAGSITVTNSNGSNGDTVLNLPDVATPGSYYNVQVDSKGRVTSGTTTFSLDWGSVTSTPTTIAGYGITDAVTVDMVGANNGVASLDSTGKIPATQLPSIALTNTFVVATQSAMLALTAQTGDVAIRTDENKTYILRGVTPSSMASWSEILTPVGGGSSGVTYINASSTNNNITVSGGPIIDMGTISVGLAGNLAQVSSLAGEGFVRAGTAGWSTVDLVNLSTDVSGTLPVANGGIGALGSSNGFMVYDGMGGIYTQLTIASGDIVGSISGNAENVNGIVAIANGGTGATTAESALNALLPAQSPATAGVLISNGTTPSWTQSIPGSYILGNVPTSVSATTADNALSLGGIAAASFAFTTGTNAIGTWPISIDGSAGTLGGYPASYFPSASGAGATGTWGISVTGSAAQLGGIPASQYTKITDVIPVSQGGTGAITATAGLNALLPTQAGAAVGQVLMTNGIDASWGWPSFTAAYQTISAVDLFGGTSSYAPADELRFGPGFVVTNGADGFSTDVDLDVSLVDIVDAASMQETGVMVMNGGVVTVSPTWAGMPQDIHVYVPYWPDSNDKVFEYIVTRPMVIYGEWFNSLATVMWDTPFAAANSITLSPVVLNIKIDDGTVGPMSVGDILFTPPTNPSSVSLTQGTGEFRLGEGAGTAPIYLNPGDIVSMETDVWSYASGPTVTIAAELTVPGV